MTDLYPLLLQPTMHVKVWGGRRLETIMNKDLPTDEPYGEAWELHDTATVINGALAGRTIGDLLTAYGAAIVGAGNDPAAGFPLLIKLLDAEQWLSVQVHPDDNQALALEGDPRGKTEAWVILATDPGAQLVIGVQPGTSRDAMAQAIREGTLEDYLVRQAVKPGDVLFIPAGTVHAIGPGNLLYEVQQSSDTTYRLYDRGRMGLDGKPRTLHIEKGVQVSNVDALPTIESRNQTPVQALVDCPFFKTEWLHSDGTPLDRDTQGRFHAVTCVDGDLTITHAGVDYPLEKGRTALIPANLGAYQLGGVGDALCSHQP
jgi:mannose-6-phosphate isomerase